MWSACLYVWANTKVSKSLSTPAPPCVDVAVISFLLSMSFNLRTTCRTKQVSSQRQWWLAGCDWAVVILYMLRTHTKTTMMGWPQSVVMRWPVKRNLQFCQFLMDADANHDRNWRRCSPSIRPTRLRDLMGKWVQWLERMLVYWNNFACKSACRVTIIENGWFSASAINHFLQLRFL